MSKSLKKQEKGTNQSHENTNLCWGGELARSQGILLENREMPRIGNSLKGRRDENIDICRGPKPFLIVVVEVIVVVVVVVVAVVISSSSSSRSSSSSNYY